MSDYDQAADCSSDCMSRRKFSRRVIRRGVALFGAGFLASVVGVAKVREAEASCPWYCRYKNYCWGVTDGRCHREERYSSLDWLGRCQNPQTSICSCSDLGTYSDQACDWVGINCCSV